MRPTEFAQRVAAWLAGTDDEQGIIVSCRARLARNLAAMPFGPRATDADRRLVVEQVLGAARDSSRLRGALYFDLSLLDATERRLLVERHLVSPTLADAEGQRGVLFNPDEVLSVMVNEEDHLRLQAILPGLRPEDAWFQVSALDDELGAGLAYAHSPRWGYLTACPTNTGTGLRVSVLMHLPGLVLTEQIEKVLRGLAQMSCAVRGFYGEGSNALGNLFQVSNQTTLGTSEPEVVAELLRITRLLVTSEREAQQVLLTEARSQVEDKVWRAFGLLSHARVLSSQEFMNLLSALRLGFSLSLIDTLPTGFMNHLMLVTQPSHLQAQADAELSSDERDVRRAALVRQRIAEVLGRT